MGTLLHIIDDGRLLNFDAFSEYLPINRPGTRTKKVA